MTATKNLVTGGSGFLGSNLCRRLLKDGEKVICLDNFSTGCKDNIDDIIANKNFQIINQDIINPIDINVDKIWHLACPASPKHYQFNPIKTAKTSFVGTYNVLELAKKINAKFLLASSSEIYGDPEVHPQKETYNGSVNTTSIRSCYEEGKRIAETLTTDYGRKFNLDIKIMRIFNTYGPFMRYDDGRVISNFIVQALQNKNLTIYGDGRQTRSFCYVDDLIRGMILLMKSSYKKPINIGNPREISIIKLANLIRDLTNTTIKFEKSVLPESDPKRRNPSIDLARNILGWEPEINLENGVKNTISWFKKIL